MPKDNLEQQDELRPEYDLDVAAMFPSAEAVNEALRFLARVAQENQTRLLKSQPNSSMTTDG